MTCHADQGGNGADGPMILSEVLGLVVGQSWHNRADYAEAALSESSALNASGHLRSHRG